jgi:mRNA interferase HicA
MTGNEFLRRITRLGRARGIAVRYDRRHGKGSHRTLHYGSYKTILKHPRK